MSHELTSARRERYRKQIILPMIGEKGQERLLSSRALVIGAGGLGSPAAMYLASCGVGTIGLADSDNLELSNLHRQVLYSTGDVGKPKVVLAEKRLKELNPDTDIRTYKLRVGQDNAKDLVKDYDVILDCSDNFETKYLVNDSCVLAGKALAHGGIYAAEGQVTFILPGGKPCYRCLFPELPIPGSFRDCRQAGILGSVPGVIGTLQATEAIKYLLGAGKVLSGRLLRYDAFTGNIKISEFKKDDRCPACGRR
jgi:adenylyltransferase/sulfurtransferase